jgi:uncharacterized membrane protein
MKKIFAFGIALATLTSLMSPMFAAETKSEAVKGKPAITEKSTVHKTTTKKKIHRVKKSTHKKPVMKQETKRKGETKK